jgi:pimeloyl-ACP methyl ester carboxylesterase
MESRLEITGSGETDLVLIHGFAGSPRIWENIAPQLSRKYRLITAELPGHGACSLENRSFSIKEIAEKLHQTLNETGINRFHLVGHSLGGYVSLALAEIAPDKTESLTLFHSNVFADSPEKQEEREKTAEFIRTNGAEAFLKLFVPKWFAPDNVPKYADLIADLVKNALEYEEHVFVNYLLAMKNRPSYEKWLTETSVPVHFIVGLNDQAVPFSVSEKQVQLNPRSETFISETAGHMGMYEDTNKVVEFLLR